MRGQISIEYIVIVAMVLILTIPILYYATSKSTEDTRLNDAGSAVEAIQSLADKVYYLGKGTRDFTTVTIPSGVTTATVVGHEINITLGIYAGKNDITRTTLAPIGGVLPTQKGTYKIYATYDINGTVIISY